MSETRTSALRRAQNYDANHPQTWDHFVRLTFQVIDAGRKHYSAHSIIAQIRWSHDIQKEHAADTFKVPNVISAFYSRKFADLYPEHKDFFFRRPSMFDSPETPDEYYTPAPEGPPLSQCEE